MGLLDRIGSMLGWGPGAGTPATDQGVPLAELPDLPLHDDNTTALIQRREAAGVSVAARQQSSKEAIGIGSFGAGLGLDGDDYAYRRLTGNQQQQRRDLTPLQQDRMLEICWYLWEQNAFARRLVTLMTDLILGDGITVEAVDPRIQDVVNQTWNHRVNQLKERLPEFHNAFSVNGSLALTVAINPITGIPQLGFIDPYQIKAIETLPDNVLVPDVMVLKGTTGQEERRLKIVRENPVTGKLEGEVIYRGINKLPNSVLGRSDLSTLADWLDLYDNYLFAEVERLNLLSAFVWDYKIEGAQPKDIDDKLKKFPKPRPGQVFAHNEKETLDARTPDLKAADRSEAGRMLRVHIAGAFGFPLSYLGEGDSNRATIEGQNDVLMKTPARRQKEFASVIDTVIRFAIEQTTGKNPALFRDATLAYRIRMPEIAAKDIARAGQVLTSVITAMDTAMANSTASRQLAVTVLVAMLKQLGVEADPQEVIDQADQDAEERQAKADDLQAAMAAAGARNPPVPDPGGGDGGDQADFQEALRVANEALAAASAERPITVNVNPAPITVEAPQVRVEGTTVNLPAQVPMKRTTVHQRTENGLLDKSVQTEEPAGS